MQVCIHGGFSEEEIIKQAKQQIMMDDFMQFDVCQSEWVN